MDGDATPKPLSGTITALEVQGRDQSRVNLYLDSRFACGLSAKTVTEAGLRRGEYLSTEKIAELLKGDDRERALLHAFNYLSYRSRSVVEMERYLKEKGHAPETVRSVLDRLHALHYLDDTTFALSWVENRQRSRPRGPHLLRSELLQKGIERETVERTITDGSGDERGHALTVARKKAESLKTADYAEFSRKMGGLLARRGFSGDVVWDTVKLLWAERDAG